VWLGLVRSTQYFVLSTVLSAAALFSARVRADDKFVDELAALAAKCDELALKDEAALTRRWAVPRHLGRQYLFLPAATDPTARKTGASEVQRQWYARFLALRTERAGWLFTAARQASEKGDATGAYQLLHEVLREDPEHAEARRVLGYAKDRRGQWQLPGNVNLQAQRPRAPEPKLGWASGSYWRLETQHFAIVTNHSAKEALELGRQLEELHALWRQVFFRYWSSPEALAARLAGRDEPLARPRPRMNVVLVRSRAEYLAHLAPDLPQIERTVGIYLNRQRKSFFYAGDTSVYPTWHHEATHQLFQESVAGVLEQPGEEQNFWAIEGAALYMESLVRHDGYWTVGGCESDRLQYARYRTLAGDFSLPLAELTALGRERVQTSPDIAKLYAQAAGVTHFLIDGQAGKHREALVELLAAVYRGEDESTTLSERAGVGLAELDQQYRASLNVTDDDLAEIPDLRIVRNLSLGRTSVTDKGIAHLADCHQLRWLDLSATAVTDEGLNRLGPLPKLEQLFLEGTQITDASLPIIGGVKSLEELDLSRLAGITDEGLAALAGLKNLKILHLSGAPISDAGLVQLRGLKQLESLETTGTSVTPEGLAKLRAALPKLK
jgi:hypothetical protein